MFYIFHGEEEFGRSEALVNLRARLAETDPVTAELNTAILDGQRLTMGELRHACGTIPFMADRRLVIVHALLSRLAPGGRGEEQAAPEVEASAPNQAFLDELAAYLPHLPSTARLVFAEPGKLDDSHPILKLARAEGKKEKQRAYVELFEPPKDWDLPHWIQQRTRSKGGDLSREAVDLLAALVGSDLRLLDQEIDKLLLYADGRQVTADDVQLLVSRAREASIFDLVDCVGRRETDRALRLLHRLLDEGEPPLKILAMLARQVRILIQVSELLPQRLTADQMASRLKIHPFVARKGLQQARNFDLTQLEDAHRRLVEADWSIKRGEMDELLALDMLVVALTHA